MTTRAARVGLVTLLLAASAAHAQTPARLCARIGTDDTLRPIPPDAADAVNHAFGLNMPAPMITATTVYRCLDGKALVCTTGANLVCGKADISPAPKPGMKLWCTARPNADFIPAYIAGHATTLGWHCNGTTPTAGPPIQSVDPRGFIARNWRGL
jgi:hypothetical protein